MASKAYTKEAVAKKRKNWEKYNKGKEKETTPKQKKKEPEKKAELKHIQLGPTIELNKPEAKTPETIQLNEPEEKKGIIEKGVGLIKGEGLEVGGKSIYKPLGTEESPIAAGALPIGAGGAIAAINSIGKATKAAIKAGNAQQLKAMGSSGGVKTILTNAKTTKASKTLLEKLFTSTKEVTSTNLQTGATKVSQVTTISKLKVGGVVAAIGAMIGTYPWGEWAAGEAKEIMGFTANKAINSGDLEVMQEFLKEQEDIFDNTVWETIMRALPMSNIYKGFSDKAKALFMQRKVNDKIVLDEMEKIKTGETDDGKWERINQERLEAEKASVDYYNNERKKMLKWEEEASDRDMKEDAAFWRKEREKQSQKEKEDMEATAKFWLEYKKQSQKLSDDSRPSNLNFGLI